MIPSPSFRLGGFLQEQELVVYISRNPQTLLHDYHCTAITMGNDRKYILRIFAMIMKVVYGGFVHERNLRRTNVLVLLGNIFVGQRRVLLKVY